MGHYFLDILQRRHLLYFLANQSLAMFTVLLSNERRLFVLCNPSQNVRHIMLSNGPFRPAGTDFEFMLAPKLALHGSLLSVQEVLIHLIQ